MKIGVLGGGFAGLTAAYELAKRNHTVVVFEKEQELGGLAIGLKQPSWEWSLEKGYHHLFTNDFSILGLLKEIGLEEKILIKRPVTANFTSGRIVQFDRPTDLLGYPDFSMIDKIRTGILLAFLKINPVWKPLEHITAKQFFETVGGSNAWKRLWEPLMIGKFGGLADSVAASWMWARITKRTPSLAYIGGGFQILVDALEQKINSSGGEIRKGFGVDSIGINKNGFTISGETFDKVLLTVPTQIITKLIPGLRRDLEKALAIPHLHAQTLILETHEPILDKTYWLSILDRTFPFLAVVAHTNLIDKKHYGGHHITYFGNYLPGGHKYLSMTKEELLSEFMPFIKYLNPNLSSKFIIHNSFSFIGPYAQPVHQLHYSRIAPKPETGIRGLFIANLDSVYPWDRGTNYAVELGRHAATRMLEV